MENKKEIIEKIRKKVIMANNPNCKSYKKVLKKESKIGDCSIRCYRLTLERVLVALKIANEKRLKSDINFLQEIAEYNDLEDISQIEEWMFCIAYPCFPFIQFQTAKFEWTITTGDNQGIISWLPNKTLEKQSERTIRDIYNIII